MIQKKFLYGSPLIIAMIYLVGGVLWIYFSDQAAVQMYNDPDEYQRLQTYKGLLFVTLSTVFIYLLVQYNNSYLSKVIRQLRNAGREKEILLSELHHRVKNNLALISALLELQIHHTDEKEAQKVLQGSRIRIKCLSMIYESLVESDRNLRIDFGSYLEHLAEFSNRAYFIENRPVALNIDIQPSYLNINQAVPCGLLCNELLGNIYRHAFRDDIQNPEITICLSDSDGLIRIEIRDNGEGLPTGVDPHDPESFGFSIVKSLVAQLKGSLEVESDHGAGFVLTFSKADRIGPSNTLRH